MPRLPDYIIRQEQLRRAVFSAEPQSVSFGDLLIWGAAFVTIVSFIEEKCFTKTYR